MPIDLQAIEARANAASPGPWEWWTSNSWRRLKGDRGHVVEPFTSRGDGHPNLVVSDEDMEFIAHARQDIPDLLDELRAAAQQAARWQALCETRILAGIEVLLVGGYSDMQPKEVLADLHECIVEAGTKGPPLTAAEEHAERMRNQLTLPGVI